MLVLDVFDNEFCRAECLLTHFTYVLLIGNNLTCLIRAVLVLHLNEQLVFLWIAELLIRPFLKDLLCRLDIILFELARSAVECRRVKDDTFNGRWQAEMLTAALSSKCSLIFSLDSTEKAVAMDLTQVEQKGVKLSIFTFNLCIEPFKWKLDLFLHVEDILDQPFGELNITTQMV